ncbi:hypothetical protein L1987_21490 [Smallanthus sonchifolius]|uniref:Uncharacterized protein n=1 Tax=Smallanthus sonchifolius TaxID=185202 RepID=A0ACB9IWM5_9ASTR|nr:hypothetical protein L1987_21490 [Smallanthus sonchifolius]
MLLSNGKYSQWNEDNPVHFVGHSAGAQVIRILQQMLADKAFKGYEESNAKWIASITTLSGAPNDWRYAKGISPLGLFCFAVTIYVWLDIPLLKRYYNFGFDHFHMSRKNIGFWGLVECLSGNAGPFVSSDWVIPDLTIQGSTQINRQLNTFPDTYYFSYVTKATKQVEGKVVPKRMQTSDIFSHIHTLWICKWCYPTNVQLPYNEYKDEDWWDNDGQLNVISMTHPRLPIEHPHCYVPNGLQLEPQPGVWCCEMVEAYHVQFVLSIRAESHIHQLYGTIFKRCRNLDTKRSLQSVT